MRKLLVIASILVGTYAVAQTYVSADNFRCIADECGSFSHDQLTEMAKLCNSIVLLVSQSGYDVGIVNECAFISFPMLGFVVDTDTQTGFYITPRQHGFSITLSTMNPISLQLSAECLLVDRNGTLTVERSGVERCN